MENEAVDADFLIPRDTNVMDEALFVTQSAQG